LIENGVKSKYGKNSRVPPLTPSSLFVFSQIFVSERRFSHNPFLNSLTKVETSWVVGSMENVLC
jgi:hypothetical protein